MRRVAGILGVVVASGVLLLAPSTAGAAGCDVLGDPRDRAECEARESAREQARAEVERRMDDAASPAGTSVDDATPAGAGRSAAWQQALEESEEFDPTALLEPRPLAAVLGLVWFGLAFRRRHRRPRAR
jgi:hypothetical protein